MPAGTEGRIEEIDTDGLRAELEGLSEASSRFGLTLTRAFASAATGGRELSEVLRSLVLSLSRQALTAALRPFGEAIGGGLNALLGAGSPTQASVAPLLRSVAPAEDDIPPLRRAERRAPVQVTVNIATPDAQSFRRSQSQIAALMVRALERGQRNL
jgi:hypothetical protein